MDQEEREKSKRMKIADWTRFLVLASLVTCLAGCRKEIAPDEAQLSIAKKDRMIQEEIRLATDWKSHFDLLYIERSFRLRDCLSDLKHNIAFEADKERYEKYMGQFIDAAFSISTDADESGARLQQLHSFCMVTETVISCADIREDFETYWPLALRRLKRIKEECEKLKARFPDGDPPGPDYPVLGIGGWDNCLKLARQRYGMAVSYLSDLINNFLMVRVLTYEKWVGFHAQLEKIVGHEVPIKDYMFKEWKAKEVRLKRVAKGNVGERR